MTTPTLDELITTAAKQIEDDEATDEVFETIGELYPDECDSGVVDAEIGAARFHYRLSKTCLR